MHEDLFPNNGLTKLGGCWQMCQEFASLTSWLLSANCLVAVRPQMYHHESQVLHELIFIAFNLFRILMHNHLLIFTHITLALHYIHDSIVSTASWKQYTHTHKKNFGLRIWCPHQVIVVLTLQKFTAVSGLGRAVYLLRNRITLLLPASL